MSGQFAVILTDCDVLSYYIAGTLPGFTISIDLGSTFCKVYTTNVLK